MSITVKPSIRIAHVWHVGTRRAVDLSDLRVGDRVDIVVVPGGEAAPLLHFSDCEVQQDPDGTMYYEWRDKRNAEYFGLGLYFGTEAR